MFPPDQSPCALKVVNAILNCVFLYPHVVEKLCVYTDYLVLLILKFCLNNLIQYVVFYYLHFYSQNYF